MSPRVYFKNKYHDQKLLRHMEEFDRTEPNIQYLKRISHKLKF